MCGLRTRPRTDVDPPRFLDRSAIGAGISSRRTWTIKKGKGSPYSITERRVPELIHVLGSQPAGDWSPLPLLSAMPAVTLATLTRELLPISLLGERRHDGCEQGVYTLQPLVQPDLQPVA